MSKRSEDHTVLSWKAPEFHFHKKNHWWFPLLALVTLVLTTLFILTQQYIVAIIVVLGGMILYQLAHQEPEVLPVVFSPRGIKFKGRFWSFRDLKSFWIIEIDQQRRLHLQSVERFASPVVIPIAKQDIEKVREFLQHYLPENQNVTEDFADRLNRWLKI